MARLLGSSGVGLLREWFASNVAKAVAPFEHPDASLDTRRNRTPPTPDPWQPSQRIKKAVSNDGVRLQSYQRSPGFPPRGGRGPPHPCDPQGVANQMTPAQRGVSMR